MDKEPKVLEVKQTPHFMKVRYSVNGKEALDSFAKHGIYSMAKLMFAHKNGDLHSLNAIGLDKNEAMMLLSHKLIKYVEPLPPMSAWNGANWYERDKAMIHNKVDVTELGAVLLDALLEAFHASTANVEEREAE